MKKILWITVLFFVFSEIHGQSVQPVSFTEKYWGLYFEHGLHSYTLNPVDTITLITCPDISGLYKHNKNGSEISGGFLFHANGMVDRFKTSFISNYYTRIIKDCWNTWILVGNVIMMFDAFGQTTFFNPKLTSEGKMVLNSWHK